MPSRSRILATAMLCTSLLCTTALAGCTESDAPVEPPADPGDVTVEVAGMQFAPATVTIDAGRSVSWHFDDRGVGHNVVGVGAAKSLLHSPVLGAGEYVQRFDDPGTYQYYCTLHPEMKGTVVVR